MNEGDRNTGYTSKERLLGGKRRLSLFIRLKDDKGTWVEEMVQIQKLTIDLFLKKLYAKDEGVVPHEVTKLLTEKVSAEMNDP